MNINLNKFLDFSKEIFADKLAFYLFAASSLLFAVDFFVWNIYLRFTAIYIIKLSGLYPIRFLVIIFFINLLLGFSSYRREKEIAYLLFGTNLFIASLIFILEIFYLVNLNYGN